MKKRFSWGGPSGLPLITQDKKDYNPDMGKPSWPKKNNERKPQGPMLAGIYVEKLKN